MLETVVVAQVMGVFALLEGLSMVLQKKMLLSIFHEMAYSRLVSYVIGLIMTILGLLMIAYHTSFASTLTSVITVIGWGMFVEGAAFLFVSEAGMKRLIHNLDYPSCYYSIGIGYLVLALYLIIAAL